MRVLLVSAYELGRQPVHVASPAARLAAAGHEVRSFDLAVDSWNPSVADWAEAVAISVPMHTAMRLAVELARQLESTHPTVPVAFYGLYAGVSIDSLIGSVVDRAIIGEYETALVDWVEGVESNTAVTTHLGKGGFIRPDRSTLPSLDHYARLAIDDDERLVGAVEASHGCLHRCRHCPLPTVYDGRFRVVDPAAVLADIDQLTEMGAQHITFGDADFLNGPAHSMRIVEAMHARYPELTFDCTVKVEHILRHREVWDHYAQLGCLFVVSAFELLNDDILDLLDKGHTAAQAAEAVHVLGGAGIDVRPSWLPFTPWTTRADVEQIFRFINAHDLISNTDPVQLGIRLLIPEGSLVLDAEGIGDRLDGFDAENLSYRWRSDDPALDQLANRLSSIAEQGAARDRDPSATFLEQWAAAVDGTDFSPPPDAIEVGAASRHPRLTEPWFC